MKKLIVILPVRLDLIPELQTLLNNQEAMSKRIAILEKVLYLLVIVSLSTITVDIEILADRREGPATAFLPSRCNDGSGRI